ncbi:TadE/TadG family type IV pilus assembly protein [Rossellomorea aquimaris]|uniref:TadE/TadG family type IV pilus assembly protein n=1 Tax=Rossellomorea aquimaris TaxID=189382 RepID=UPI0007D0696C|nr:Tad domain-containing protein [Rossellomorea aquimaris]
MVKVFRLLMKEEKGNALVLVTLALMSLLTMAGLAIDGGMLFMTKSHLQKAANAAVLSGAQELPHDTEEVKLIVNDILSSHDSQIALQNIEITPEKGVGVDIEKSVKLAFSSLLGKESVNVEAHAAAKLGVMGKAVGAAPLGIDEKVVLEYYKTYKLKVDSNDVEYGNFGVLALGGTGAETYEDNLRNGYQDEIKVGDILETQTGNIAGKTRSVVSELVNGCTENPRDVNERDCSRVILIPVYSEHSHDVNQLKEVEIKGFAYFYITDPMDPKDTSITGMFIKRTGTGFEDDQALNKGAFSIRLTE